MALIPAPYLNSLVSIEVDNKDNKGLIHKVSIATGFLIGKKTEKRRFKNCHRKWSDY